MQDRPTDGGYGMICRRELDRILDGERTRSAHIAQLKNKARECHETAGSEPGASHYQQQARRLTKSKVAFSTVLTVWAFVTVECSGRPGECYPLSCRSIVEKSRSKGGAAPMLPMRQVQRAALELERLGMLERWTFEGVEMWGIRFPDIEPKRRRRRTPPKKQSGASAAEGGASAARTSISMTEVFNTTERATESGKTTTAAPHAPNSLESWLAAGKRDGVDLGEVEAMWQSFHGTEQDAS
jgi:hypothetical protein